MKLVSRSAPSTNGHSRESSAGLRPRSSAFPRLPEKKVTPATTASGRSLLPGESYVTRTDRRLTLTRDQPRSVGGTAVGGAFRLTLRCPDGVRKRSSIRERRAVSVSLLRFPHPCDTRRVRDLSGLLLGGRWTGRPRCQRSSRGTELRAEPYARTAKLRGVRRESQTGPTPRPSSSP